MTENIVYTDVELISYDKYTGTVVLKPIIPVLNEVEVMDLPLLHSKLPEGSYLNGTTHPKITKYAQLMRFIYSTMPLNTILKNTTMNITTEERNTDGYRHHPALGFSYQSKDTKGTLREIIQMCRVQNYFLELKIQLKDGRIVLFRM